MLIHTFNSEGFLHSSLPWKRWHQRELWNPASALKGYAADKLSASLIYSAMRERMPAIPLFRSARAAGSECGGGQGQS